MKDKKDLEKLYKDCVECWGLISQLEILQEECAELIEAISHFKRNRAGSKDEVIEELGDVTLMLNEIVPYFGEGAVNNIVDIKSDRMKKHVESYKEKRNGI